MTGTKTAARDVTAELAYLTRALKAPTLRESAGRLAERARTESWTHEEYLAACLQREVAAREESNARTRRRQANFPVGKTLEEFDLAASSVPRATFDYLSGLEWVRAAENLCLIGPAGTE